MSHDAVWDRAWYAQDSNPRFVSVEEAIRLRDSDTLKTGDLFCCNGDCQVRLGPRRSYFRKTKTGQTRVRGCFRRLPGPRKEKVTRTCTTHVKSQLQGETWKHARVLAEITNYLTTNEGFNVSSVRRLDGIFGETESSDEADLLITHNDEILAGSDELRLICRFQNMRRANKVINRHYPNIIFIDMHRWRDADIDFIDYIHSKVDEQYERIRNPKEISIDDLIHKLSYTYPNLGIFKGKGQGYGLQGVIKFEEGSESLEYEKIHKRYTDLLQAVENHNFWAINEPGMHKYHLKYLDFGDYTNFYNFSPGITDKESNEPFPKAISIMMQENFHNHVINQIAMTQLLSGEEKASFTISDALLFGDGQKGHNGFPIGLAETNFVNGWSEGEIFFGLSSQEFGKKFTENINKLLETERKRELDKFTWIAKWDRYKNVYTYNGESKTIPNFEDIKDQQCAYTQWIYHLAIPDLLFWHSFDNEQKIDVFERVKKLYRKLSVFMGRLVVMPLVDIELNGLPKTVVDTTEIYTKISTNTEIHRFGEPLSLENYFLLKWVILADKFYPQINAPIIKEILFSRKHSTDELTTQVTFDLPISLQENLDLSNGLNEAILDRLLSLRTQEEE